MRVTARGREEVLLTAIDELTRQLRRRLGESLASIARTDPPFAQYTTSSLEALRLLGLGQAAWGNAEMGQAERCFREALQRDPHFAAARGALGLVLIQFTKQTDEGRKQLAQALAEAGDVSPRESAHLRALNKQFVSGDLEGALEDYRFMRDLYPDALVPYNNSGRILEQLGRFGEAADMFERAHGIDPANPIPLWNAWFLNVHRLKDAAVALRDARALLSLLPDSANAAHAVGWSLIMRRKFTEAEEAMRAALELDREHRYALPNLGHLLLRRGAAAEAVSTYRRVVKQAGPDLEASAHATLCLSLALEAAGQRDEARRVGTGLASAYLALRRKAALSIEGEAFLAVVQAAAGQRDEAGTRAARLEGRATSVDAQYHLARVYALLGEPDRAAAWLERAFASGHGDPFLILVNPPLAALRDHPVVDRLLAPEPGTGAKPATR